MWTIEEGDREYFYGAGVAHQSGYGYAPHPSYGYGHSHGYGGPHATAYSVDMPAMEPTVELSVDMHSDRSRKAIMRKLAKLKGVATVDVDLHRQKVTVTGNVTPAEVLKKVRRTGRKAHFWMGGDLHTSGHVYTPGYVTVPVTGALVYTN